MLRPETVESLFIAYRLTGDDKYRQYGWKIFEAIERHCRVEEGGYTTVLNVDAVPVEHEDKMETFLMVSPSPRLRGGKRGGEHADAEGGAAQSETLKYLYLLFEDDSAVPLSSACFQGLTCFTLSLTLTLQNTSSTPRSVVFVMLPSLPY